MAPPRWARSRVTRRAAAGRRLRGMVRRLDPVPDAGADVAVAAGAGPPRDLRRRVRLVGEPDPGGGLAGQVGDPAVVADPAAVQYDHALAQGRDVFGLVRGQHHDRRPRDLREHRAQCDPLFRVDAAGRLVQDQHRRRPEQRLRQRDPPARPAGAARRTWPGSASGRPKVRLGPVEPCLHAAHRYVQQVRRFPGGQAVQHDGLVDGAHLRRQPGQRLADVAVLDRQQHLVFRGRCGFGFLEHGGDAAAGPQAAHQPPDRDPPQPRRDVAVAAEALRFLPDGDEGVLDRVRHEVAVVAPPGEPDREPAGVAFVERTEGAHVAFGDGEQQPLVARAAVHALTVASPGRKSFTPRRKSPRACPRRGVASGQAAFLYLLAYYLVWAHIGRPLRFR